MRLQIGSVIDNKHVRLDFRKSPDRPENIPSYKIENSKADEFVQKYNKLNDKLTKTSNTIILLSSLLGFAGAFKIFSKEVSHKMIKSGATLLGTIALGVGISALISTKTKNNLMDKYNVRELK